jgi:hypothetical protein
MTMLTRTIIGAFLAFIVMSSTIVHEASASATSATASARSPSSGPVSHGPVKLRPAPVPLTRRMTLNVSCYMNRYRQLRNAGQDAGLASAGAALICG